MENSDVAKILRETAQLLEIDGAIIGRYRSYEKVAELLYSIPERIEDLAKDPKKLKELPGIGDSMAEHIREILDTGDYSLRKKLRKKYPPTLLDLLELQSLGPKKVAFLWSHFKVATVEGVEKLAKEGKLRDLPGFGEKSEQNILKAAGQFKNLSGSGRVRINVADDQAQKLIAYISKAGEAVESVTPAGSLRRGRETVGDLDLLVTMRPGHDKQKDVDAVAALILKYPGIDQELAHGENKVSFNLGSGLQVDVRLLEKKSFGAALLYFTGSKAHNVALRGRANDMGWTLNEYALTTLKGGKVVASKTEEEIYSKLKLAYIEPELREMTGEIEAAESGKLPELVALEDIRGDLQMHTTASDGKNSIEEMGQTAKDLGYDYIALTDHSQAVTVANGLDEKRTLEQIKKIHATKVPGITLLAGSEVDIKKDGTLDLEDYVLAELDVVVASVHSYMNMDRAEMTKRMMAAVENPYTQIIAHPTGRLVLRREAFEYDMEAVLDACAKHGVVMECNAYPDRLDLRDVHLRMAKQRGVKIVISTDSHTTGNLSFMKYGVETARRGWIEKKDVINTLPLKEFLAALRPKPSAAKSRAAKQKSA
ncbi:MAG TPA: DNA polymerase/3'-5' exonuclease PolX [Candidatus Acidoferrales bacterium]|jgi:DNA polymerase (family 10)|nr:DNA polymerase/3'-5' exonuclease PolX [Candidatus Acidoferrales bacterium]